jgi:hypothetical protein
LLLNQNPKTPDNPEGVDGSVFEGIQKAVVADRYAFSEWANQPHSTDERMPICDAVSDGRMPLLRSTGLINGSSGDWCPIQEAIGRSRRYCGSRRATGHRVKASAPR